MRRSRRTAKNRGGSTVVDDRTLWQLAAAILAHEARGDRGATEETLRDAGAWAWEPAVWRQLLYWVASGGVALWAMCDGSQMSEDERAAMISGIAVDLAGDDGDE